MKSSWAYKNGKRIMKECTKKDTKKISFLDRRGAKLYAEYGNVKVYANKKTADSKVQELQSLGYPVERSLDHPFTIILN